MPGCRPRTEAEVDLVAQSFGGTYATRDCAPFVLGIYTGFRITALLSLRLQDVYQHQHVLSHVTVPRRHMKGKGASRSVPLHPVAQLALAAWIAQMPRHFVVTPESVVFRSREGDNQPISRMHAHRLLRDAFDSCEMTGNLGTHSMRRKDAVFLKRKALLEPFGLTHYSTDTWGAYPRHLAPEQHTTSQRYTQKIERKHLTLRTRITRLVRKTICFSKSTQMHDLVIGLFVNRYAFGRAV